MKRVARLSVFFGLSVVLFVNAVFGFNLGDPMGGSFQDVYAISNGDENMGRTDDQYIYQCVDYVKRYYQFRNVLPNLNLDYRIYVARNYYVKYDDPGFSFIKESGFLRFSNGGDVAPEPGDILVYDDPSGSYGHAAIITNRTANSLETIEQNWSLDGRFTLPLSVSSGHYNVICNRTDKNGSFYNVLGWLGLRVGMFQDGWHNENYSLSFGRSQAFVNIYNEMGGQKKMGVPADNNGGGVYA
ncbi:MAG: hypothetical protein A2390_01595 [Candidatus Liptonbacteria bacterium RIFOXYB1_FULL_36_10]|uniref:Peptidase C51 domain-containing protein n=1 Tax=Candidatus Liptonbacteria bacterium RIFOXYB1_FULL_36_10 TaxID=1798654 RepID=A0A1G2CLQ8_9BACT|nr:MAG: hypothetical protein A2390_01595 [Candidatus Liptonbacteria bacterium RIFOXYB1_FULL_36_10]